MNLPKSGASYTYSSGENTFGEDRSFDSSESNYINYRQKKMRAFNPESYKREKWLYDTPGVILPEQVGPRSMFIRSQLISFFFSVVDCE